MGSRTGFGNGRDKGGEPPPSKGIVRDYIETILVCVIFVIFSRAFVFQQSKIPSGSMKDTLLVGDYIMVNRFLYAPTSFGWESSILPQREIRRGDIAVFKFPNEPETDYIKRIVGLPGDTVEIKQGFLYVNGQMLSEPYVKEEYRQGGYPLERKLVPPGQYLALGDHRNESSDSRVWGFVPGDLIKGRALLIWWSYEESSHAANPRGIVESVKSMADKAIHFATRSRWRRCFTLIR